jgi:hypothetical protein
MTWLYFVLVQSVFVFVCGSTLAVGTLMNLCDHPNRVAREEDSNLEEYREDDMVRRVPIIVTAGLRGGVYDGGLQGYHSS